MESLRRNSGKEFIEFFKRERGLCTPRNYARRISSSKTLIEHIDRYGQLSSQEGAVDTLAFNTTGEIIISATEYDNNVMLWEWETKKLISSYPSGHFNTVLQAKSMPFTDDRKIVTSGTDGEVRLIESFDNGASHNKMLSEHNGIVHSLAVETGSSYCFYSCGEDGFVKHHDLRNCSAADLFYCPSYDEPNKNMELFSIVIDPGNPNYFAVGGEDSFARVYDLRSFCVNSSTKEGSPVSVFCPKYLWTDTDDVLITSLAYSNTSELLVSYTDNTINLFQRNMGYPSIEVFFSADPSEYQSSDQQIYRGHWNWNEEEPLIGVCFFGPNSEYVLSGSDTGCIFIWDKKSCTLTRSMVADEKFVSRVQPHPLIPIFATSGSESNVKIWGRSSNKPAIQMDEVSDSDTEDDSDDDDDEVDSAGMCVCRVCIRNLGGRRE